MKKRNRLIAAVTGGVLVVIGLIGTVLVRGSLRDRLIVLLGYGSWRVFAILPVLLALVGLALVLLAVGLLISPKIRAIHEQKNALMDAEAREKQLNTLRQIESERRKKLRDDLRTPEGVYRYFDSEIGRNSDSEVKRCRMGILDQLDTMNTLQSRLHRLIELNDISALSQAENVLQQVEDAICQDCRTIINRYIALGLEDGPASESDARDFRETSDAVMEDNQRKLDKAQDLLRAVADMANGQITGEDANRTLETYIDTLRYEINETIAFQKGDLFSEKTDIPAAYGSTGSVR